VLVPLIVMTLGLAVALAASWWGVRRRPDGTPTPRAPVNKRHLAAWSIPVVVVLVLLLITTRDNGDRLGILAVLALLAVFLVLAVRVRKGP
jgi:hypothetical protein